jgi:hypothetical protein
MTTGTPWTDQAMATASRIEEPAGASEFGGAPGPDAHAHADPPPTQGYPGRYIPLTPPESVNEIATMSTVSRPRTRH